MSLGKLVHYPWLGDQARERFAFGAPWCDPDGLLLLNGEQRAHFGRWARPSEFMRGEPRMIYLVSPLTITQTIITDCSFVSSLVIAASFERRSSAPAEAVPAWAPPRRESPDSWQTRAQEDGTPLGGGVDLAGGRTGALFDLED